MTLNQDTDKILNIPNLEKAVEEMKKYCEDNPNVKIGFLPGYTQLYSIVTIKE